MMNFLLEEDKKIIRKEYWRRLLGLAGIFSFSTILIGTILLFSVFLLLKSEKANFTRQVVISEERLRRSQAENIVPLVRDLNSKIVFLEEGWKNIEEKSTVISGILEEKPEGVKINNLFFDKKKITIQGFSNTRQGLLLLVDNLKKKGFKKVESPISNIIKEKDIEFSINIDL